MEDMDQLVKDYQRASKLVLRCQEVSWEVTIKIIKRKVRGGKVPLAIMTMIKMRTTAPELGRKTVNLNQVCLLSAKDRLAKIILLNK